ncbi:MAG: hypothetical protein KJ621_13485 [Proteobacteria bacterium]|nr:hypothetical protein [Pseudomonadota bacterium]MBU1742829.1 hypothetical protein [Pseudomonadota bacterium]
MADKCARDDVMTTGTPQEYKCPNCGNEVEIFSTEQHRKCRQCGEVVERDQAEQVR